jgi:SNF2 family DNA or RNA helicase
VAENTVDEDIFDMGERKRLLSQAVLSDNQSELEKTVGGGKKTSNSKKTAGKEEEGEDLAAISNILSKALSRHGIKM